MNGRYLLDTNICIAFINDEESVVENVDSAASVLLSSTVLGELLYGVEQSTRKVANRKRVEALAADTGVLSCDAATAQHFGALKAFCRQIGKPIPDNDLWIAAVACQHELTLVTRDHHFDHLAPLKKVSW